MIERIYIEGYKSIKEMDLKLKPINILIGANGSGKSNLISYFKLVHNLYELKIMQLHNAKYSRRLSVFRTQAY